MHRGDTFAPIRLPLVQLLQLQLLIRKRRRKKLHRSVQWTILTRSNCDHYSHAANNSTPSRFFFNKSLKVRNCCVVFLSKSSFMFLLHVNLELAKSSHLFRGGKQLWAQRYQQILATGHFIYIGRGKTIQRSFLTIQERDHCIKYSFNFVCIFESSFIPKATIMIYQHRKRFLSIHPNPLI